MSYLVKISLATGAFLVFLILKLTDTIAWSWWWVASPLLAAIGLRAIVWLVMFAVALPRAMRAERDAKAVRRSLSRLAQEKPRRRYR